MASHSATYSAEDNKLRLYVGRVPRADYDRLRAAGFTSTPKQDCDFVATWTPDREDLAREFLEEDEDIGDEDYSPQERAADRAERFEGYREKRLDEATGAADRFDAGPSAFGHQNRARAERQAARHDRHRGRAVSQWSKAEYWQARTAGVIANALYKSSAAVRRSRILRLEAEQRKHEKTREEYAAKFRAWSKVSGLAGADVRPEFAEDGSHSNPSEALRLAYNLANNGRGWFECFHPRTGNKASLYSHLSNQTDPMTPRECAEAWLKVSRDPSDPDSYSARWSEHYTLRLGYERAMLAEEGGSAAEADMEPGGWIGKRQIHGVNRSPATGRIVSVKIMAPSGLHGDGPLKLKSYNVERLPEGAYRAPTDEERAAFATATKERKATEKATAPKVPPLVNPTDEDAERLQALWNARAAKKFEEWKRTSYGYGDYTPTEVTRLTQSQYSARSQVGHGGYETIEVCTGGRRARRWHEYGEQNAGPVAFKIRKAFAPSTGWTGNPYSIVIITDKPQKPIPLDWDAIANGTTNPVVPATTPVVVEEPEPPAYEDAPQEFETSPGLLFAR